METMGERLQRALDESDGVSTPADLARLAKTTEATISNWLGDKVQPDHAKGKLALRVCSLLNIRPEWLLEGRLPMRPADSMEADYAIIPMVSSRYRGGEGNSADVDTKIGGLHFLRRSLSTRGLDLDSLIVVFADGRSMAPRIQAGDVMLVDQSKRWPIAEGKVYVIDAPMPKGRMVKRLFVETDGRIRVKSDNESDPEFATWHVQPDDPNFSIVGRVVWTAGWMP